MRSSLALTRRGWGFALTGLGTGGAWFGLGIRDIWYLAAFLLAVLVLAVLSLVPLPRLARFETRLSTADPTPTRGSSVRVAVEVRQRLSIPLRIALEWGAGRVHERDALSVSSARPASRTLEFVADRRGPVFVRVRAIVVRDPLGLSRLRIHGDADLEVLVLPALVAGLPAARGSASSPSLGTVPSGRTSAHASGEPSGTVREFRTGDAIRQVHWKQSARQGALLVNVPEDADRAERTLLLDTLADAYGAGTDEFERAVSAAATLAVRWLDDGHPLRLIVGEDEHEPLLSAGDALRALARVEPDPSSPSSAERDRAQPLPSLDAVVTGTVTARLRERLTDPSVPVYAVARREGAPRG